MTRKEGKIKGVAEKSGSLSTARFVIKVGREGGDAEGNTGVGEPGEYPHPTARLEINPHYGSLD